MSEGRTQKSIVLPVSVVAALLIGTALTILAFAIVWRLENIAIAADLEAHSLNRFNAVQNALIEQTQLLESVTAHFQASSEVDRESFRTFVARLLPQSPQLQAIGYAPLVPQSERDSFERMATGQHGISAFRIMERDDEGRLRPAARRDFYTPVLYIEPMLGNEAAVGFDLLSEPKRRAALEAARDTAQSQTTSRLHLVQDKRSRIGLLSALPSYRFGASLRTVDERRAALEGFVTQVYWIDEVIEAGVSQLQPGGVDLYFYDPLDPPDAGPLYVHASRIRDPDDPVVPQDIAEHTSSIRHQGELDIGHRQLRVIAIAAPGFVATRRGLLPWVLLAGGLLATILSVAYLTVTARRERHLRQAHHGLEISAERLRHVLENMPVLMIAFDADGDLIMWNRECERVTGYSAGAVLGKATVPNLDIPTPAGDSRDFRGVERTVRARDGAERTIAWSNVSAAIPVSGWNSWFIGIDVSEREAILKQLLHSQKLEGLGVMAGGIAHDFNNLLTAILGNASIAQASLPKSDPSQAALAEVVKASERAAMLTQQLLAYAGKTTLQTVPVDLSAHVREIAGLLRAAISRKVELVMDLDDDLPPVDADPAQLQQLVMNLVVNGAEACERRPGSVRMRTHIREVGMPADPAMESPGDVEPGTYVRLEVRDDGAGMAPEVQQKIFDPFFSTKFTGRGLGLAAVLGIVRSHKGSISVDSTPGKGSVFEVLLPVSKVERAPRREDASNVPTGEGLILVVDDEPLVLRLATAALEKLGYRVATAESGREAVDYFRIHGSDVTCVLLDMTMPGMDGQETFESLRSVRADVLVVLSSGYSEVSAIEQFDGTRPAGFIQKPYTVRGLGEKIKEAIARKSRH